MRRHDLIAKRKGGKNPEKKPRKTDGNGTTVPGTHHTSSLLSIPGIPVLCVTWPWPGSTTVLLVLLYCAVLVVDNILLYWPAGTTVALARYSIL